MDAKDRIIEQRMAKRRRNALIVRSLIVFLIVLIVLFAVILLRSGVVTGIFKNAWDEFYSVMTGNPAGSGSGTADPNAPVRGDDMTFRLDVDFDEAYTPDTEVIKDGYFHESEYRSAPYFDIRIDGITLKNQLY